MVEKVQNKSADCIDSQHNEGGTSMVGITDIMCERRRASCQTKQVRSDGSRALFFIDGTWIREGGKERRKEEGRQNIYVPSLLYMLRVMT